MSDDCLVVSRANSSYLPKSSFEYTSKISCKKFVLKLAKTKPKYFQICIIKAINFCFVGILANKLIIQENIIANHFLFIKLRFVQIRINSSADSRVVIRRESVQMSKIQVSVIYTKNTCLFKNMFSAI